MSYTLGEMHSSELNGAYRSVWALWGVFEASRSYPNCTGRVSCMLGSPEVNIKEYLLRRAGVYQKFMKGLEIPDHHHEVSPTSYETWVGVRKALETKYNQPLHYLTNVQLDKWDQASARLRKEQKNEFLADPAKAETMVWDLEKIHRRATSHFYLADLWKEDKSYYKFMSLIPEELQPNP